MILLSKVMKNADEGDENDSDVEGDENADEGEEMDSDDLDGDLNLSDEDSGQGVRA